MFSGSAGSSTGTISLLTSCLLRKMSLDTLCVNFQPAFHTDVIQQALALLPPLCPIAKGKHCMFMFVLEVLDRDRPGPSEPGSFVPCPRREVGVGQSIRWS